MTEQQLPKGKFIASILSFLSQQEKPQSAYDILDALRDEGAKAPMQIYRALAKLEEAGLAHKLPKSNGWIACHSHHHHEEAQLLVLLSCQSCGTVAEHEDTSLQSALISLANKSKFEAPAQTIEVDGTCLPCQTKDTQ